jgi:hypothetical protein
VHVASRLEQRPPRGRGQRALLRRRELRQLPLGQQAELREIGAVRPVERGDLLLDAPLLAAQLLGALASAVDRVAPDLIALGPRLAPDQLGLALGLLLGLVPELLRRDQRLVEGAVAIAERAQLLVEVAGLLVELLVQTRQTLELRGDLLTELLDARLVVAAQGGAEVVAPRIERGQAEGVVGHRGRTRREREPTKIPGWRPGGQRTDAPAPHADAHRPTPERRHRPTLRGQPRAPNRRVPSRTSVAPSSTATA